MDHWEGIPDPEVFEGEKSVLETWEIMSKALNVTQQQKNDFVSLGEETRSQENSMRECFRLLEGLETNFDAKSEGMESKIDQITRVITPAQSVLFLNWIENNKAVIHMIDEAEFRREL